MYNEPSQAHRNEPGKNSLKNQELSVPTDKKNWAYCEYKKKCDYYIFPNGVKIHIIGRSQKRVSLIFTFFRRQKTE